MTTRQILSLPVIILFLVLTISTAESREKDKGTKRQMSYEDIMKFKGLRSASISDNGKWVTYYAEPERGDGEAYVQSTEDSVIYTVKRGASPVFTHNSLWVAMSIKPRAMDVENADKDKDKPKTKLGIMKLPEGKVTEIDNVANFALSEDSKWIAYKAGETDEKKGDDPKKKKIIGNQVMLRHLETGAELVLENVTEFAFDSLSNYFAYVVSEQTGKKNGLYNIALSSGFNIPQKIAGKEKSHFSTLTWNNAKELMAFIQSKENSGGEADSAEVKVWDTQKREIVDVLNLDACPKDWTVAFKNNMKWSRDGNRLFFGLKNKKDSVQKEEKVTFSDSTFYDVNTITKKADFDLWHWNDPRIKTNQKKWAETNKDNTYLCVYHYDIRKFVQLGTLEVPEVEIPENTTYTVGYNSSKYLKEVTWDTDYQDVYRVDMRDGSAKLLLTHYPTGVNMSPGGNYICYFKDQNWYLYHIAKDSTEMLNELLKKIKFYNEEWDQPCEAPSYGLAGWIENDAGVLIYDRYDIWKFLPGGGGYLNMTAAEGRLNQYVYRMANIEPDRIALKRNDNAVVTVFSEKDKWTKMSRINMNILGPETVIREDLKIRPRAIPKDAYKILYTKERNDMYPDLWICDSTGTKQKKLSDINPQMKEILMGKAKLMDWVSTTGDTLQGFYIYPDTLLPEKRYPVLVYFYEKFSDTYNNFYQPALNHRPCYQYYTSDDYVIFVPDVVYKTGNPGMSAINCILPGLRKLIDMGIADSTAIGVQGHSWGGYQIAYMITQTNIFAAAASGAPVGNMTSAYSGIRLESGLARQFQYEKAQSRIGGNLWDSLDSYLRNSPVFHTPKVQTPYLIMFGDRDDAVPWQQGIELYMAFRRLNKSCYFLQYHDEPHIPKKYANKVDYALRMKEFFDTYLKKKPAPDWMQNGIEYKIKEK